jgi:1-acyl-sn-glycerol-3-phosphate acyltransferase
MLVESIKDLFSKDSYDTPPDSRRYIMDRLLFNSRWWFYFLFAGVIIRSSRKARKGVYDDGEWIKSSYEIIRALEGCGGRFVLRGLDNLRKFDEPMVIVGNHMSTLETVALPGIVAPFLPLTFVVKDRLVKGRVFGPVMRSRDPVVVGRTNPREDLKAVMSGGKERLEQGRSLVIFPQSTRTLEFNPEKFNSLGIKLARRAGVKVIPLAVKTDFWGEGKRLKGFGKLARKKPIYMTFGEPIEIKGSGKEEHQHVVEFIRSHLEGWSQGE